jgi:hypothetical protein
MIRYGFAQDKMSGTETGHETIIQVIDLPEIFSTSHCDVLSLNFNLAGAPLPNLTFQEREAYQKILISFIKWIQESILDSRINL